MRFSDKVRSRIFRYVFGFGDIVFPPENVLFQDLETPEQAVLPENNSHDGLRPA